MAKITEHVRKKHAVGTMTDTIANFVKTEVRER